MDRGSPPRVRVARPLSPPPPPPPDNDAPESVPVPPPATAPEGHHRRPSPFRRPSPIPRRMSAADFISSTPPVSPAIGPSLTGCTYQQVFYYLPPRHHLDKSGYPAALDPFAPDEDPRAVPPPSGPNPPAPAARPYPSVLSDGPRRFSLPSPPTHTSLSRLSEPKWPSVGSMGGPHGAHGYGLGLPPFGGPSIWDSLTPRQAAALRYLQDPILMDGEVAPSIPRSVIDVTPRPLQLPAFEPVLVDRHHRTSWAEYHYP
eukprot:EG_transcript_22839